MNKATMHISCSLREDQCIKAGKMMVFKGFTILKWQISTKYSIIEMTDQCYNIDKYAASNILLQHVDISRSRHFLKKEKNDLRRKIKGVLKVVITVV